MAKKETFGQRLRRIRQARGISLPKAAQAAGISKAYLSRIERDEFAPPAEDKIRALARLLDQNEDALLFLGGRIPSDRS